MRFLDPLPCRCASCHVESLLPVRDLLALEALCPICNASFREVGLSMRRAADEAATFYDAVVILMHIEEALGITIADETVEAIRPWSELTLQDLAAAAERSSMSDNALRVDQAIRAAVRAEFPNASEPLNFAAPLLKTLSSKDDCSDY